MTANLSSSYTSSQERPVSTNFNQCHTGCEDCDAFCKGLPLGRVFNGLQCATIVDNHLLRANSGQVEYISKKLCYAANAGIQLIEHYFSCLYLPPLVSSTPSFVQPGLDTSSQK